MSDRRDMSVAARPGSKRTRVAVVASAPNHHTTRFMAGLSAEDLDVHLLYNDTGRSPEIAGLPSTPIVLGAGSLPVLSAVARWRKALTALDPDVICLRQVSM